MEIKGTYYNEDAVKLLTLEQFSKQHENLRYFKNLPTKERAKALKETYLKIVGQIKK